MLDFHYPKVSDKDWATGLLALSQYMGCEYSFGNIFMWSSVFKTKITKHRDFLITKGTGKDPSFCCPAGNGDFKMILSELMTDAKQCGHPFRMFGLTAECTVMLENMYPGKFEFEPYRDGFDYIYLTGDLVHLEGKKYHSKRNHISAFEKANNWSFEMISEKNIEECIKMNAEWEMENRDKNPESIAMEQKAITLAFENYFVLGFTGGLIRVEDKPVAFTIGEKLNDLTYCLHFEKAYAGIRGAYPMINREFAANALRAYKYINREDDAGSEGLRKAKLSYHPTIILEKFSVTVKGET